LLLTTARSISPVESRVDQWNGRQGVALLDGAEIWRSPAYYQQGGYTDGRYGLSLWAQVRGDNGCGVKGYNQGDLAVEIDVTPDHYSPNATLRFTSTLDQKGDYWGIQDVRISLTISHPSPPAPPLPPGIWAFAVRERWPSAVGWTVSNLTARAVTASTAPVTTCGNLGTFFGGFEKFGAHTWVEKTLYGLPLHTGLRFRFQWLKVDQWQSNKGQLYVDGALAWESPVLSGEPRVASGSCVVDQQGAVTGGDCCGVISYQQGDQLLFADVEASHYAPTATLRFTSNLVVQSGYWGINDLLVTLSSDHPSPPAPPAAPGVWSDVLDDRWPGALGWTSSVSLDASTVTTCGALVRLLDQPPPPSAHRLI